MKYVYIIASSNGNLLKVLGLGRAAQHVHPPVVRVLALGPEEVDVVLERQLEDELLLQRVLEAGRAHAVPEQRQAGQRELVLVRLVEVQAEGREHHPQLLPATAVLELAQQEARQLVVQRYQVVVQPHSGAAVPAHMQCRVAARRGPLVGERRLLLELLWRQSAQVQALLRRRTVLQAGDGQLQVRPVLDLLGGVRQLGQPQILLGRRARADRDRLLTTEDDERIVLRVLGQQRPHRDVTQHLESGIDRRLAGINQHVGELKGGGGQNELASSREQE